MKQALKDHFGKLVVNNLLVSTGCTEPIAIAYAAAIARKTLNEVPTSIELYLSGNMVKNAMDAGVPGSKFVGAAYVASLGALSADSSKGFELLAGLTSKDYDAAFAFSKENVKVHIAITDKPLYIEVVLKGSSTKSEGDGLCTKPNTAKVVVCDTHTSVKVNEYNGKSVINNSTTSNSAPETANVSKVDFNLSDIYEYVEELDDLKVYEDAVNMNLKLSELGKKQSWGLDVGKVHPFGETPLTRIITAAASGVDARMAGAELPATACTGSGNQGITITLPIYQAAIELGVDHKTATKAVAIGILSAIYVKQNLNVLSYLCGAVTASAGAAAGITYLLGGTPQQIEYAIQNVLVSVTGMFCDGAKSTCALKVAAGVSIASFASHLAMTDTGCIKSKVGIACSTLSDTLKNIHLIESNACDVMNNTILGIMTD